MADNRSTHMYLIAITAITSLVVVVGLSPERAQACEEESEPLVFQSGKVYAEVGDGGVDLEDAREAVQWISRIDAMLPEGYTVSAYQYGEIEVCVATSGAPACKVISHSYDGLPDVDLFEKVAARLRVPKAGRAWMAKRVFPSWTIQVASTPHYEGAHNLTAAFDEPHGDISFALTGNAGVMHTLDKDGEAIHKVMLGVYSSYEGARADLARLGEAGRVGYVRKL